MFNKLILFLCFIIPFNLLAQIEIDSILDIRDNRIYKTIKINNTVWFQDNLQFETKNSFYPNQTKNKRQNKKGNYYSNIELENLCPVNWEIPTEKDWKNYFEYLMNNKEEIWNIRIDSLQEEYISLVYRDSSNTLNLFSGNNPLMLNELGWVEGKKIRNWGTTTYWIKHSEIEDKRFHIHLENEKFVIHRHEHNIKDKKKRKRKFLIRCIQYEENN